MIRYLADVEPQVPVNAANDISLLQALAQSVFRSRPKTYQLAAINARVMQTLHAFAKDALSACCSSAAASSSNS